ncbi:MAG: tRNA-dihydrouridine synthase [Candidatus Yanofskybacteria bacterium]|nr:tRNA-dihydrouridine synthase [Candidatus Yanofskybacteria bacterium]
MADVTDVPFRSIVVQCGRPDVFYTEFVSAHGLASAGRERLMLDLALTPTDHPIVAQFFGTEPEHLRAAGALARELGFDGVDINMGCPDRAIMRQGAGAALIRDPGRAKELIHAIREGAGDLPVAVKTRLGLRSISEMNVWIPEVLSAKPDVLVVHGRTVAEMSKVPAHWDLIGQVASMARDADILCVGNGDVMSRAQGLACAAESGVDGIMVGRGIFHDPWLFAGHTAPKSPRERLQLLLDHTDAWVAHWGGVKSFDLMKKFYKVYVSGWDGAAHLRARLMEARDPETVRAVVAESGML